MPIISAGSGDVFTPKTSTSATIVKVVAEIKKKGAGDTEREEKRGITTKAYKTPPQIVASQDNYDSGTLDALRLDTDASRVITGFAGGRKGRYLLIVNKGTSNIVLNNEDASSLEINRILVPGGSNLTLTPGQSAQLWYDYDSQRWRVLFHS